MAENKGEGKKYRGGRKPVADPAVFRYSIKLNSADNAKFEALFIKSGLTEKSGFIKTMIFGRKIKVVKVDKAAMDYYMRLTNIYVQYKAVGVNYNQVVKAVKANFDKKRAMSLLYKLGKAKKELWSKRHNIENFRKNLEDCQIGLQKKMDELKNTSK